jgi:hypothetical protein
MASPTTKKWLLGCGVGCGAVILLGILLMIGGSFVMMRPFKKAITAREALDEKYGGQAEYTPTFDGAIAADRLETFLQVRQALMAKCGEFAQAERQFERLDELGEDPPKRVILEEFFNLTKTVIGMGPRMGDFFHARNTALLEAGMGRSEYTYIYVLAYHHHLHPDIEDEDLMLGSRHLTRRVQQVLAQILRNQLSSLEENAAAAAEDLATGGLDPESWRESLQNEVWLLENHPRRLPWQDGLPVAIASSLEPYRTRLDELYCEQTVAYEFTQNRMRGIGIQGD